MGFLRKKQSSKIEQQEEHQHEIVSVSIDEVRRAVNRLADRFSSEIPLRTIIRQTNEIDFELLADDLGGIPDRPFYMSRETYEVFEDQELPGYIDRCQIAVDQYVLETGSEPVMPNDPARRINFQKLKHYLSDPPPFELYLHPVDRMVTHRKPA
ncbi:DUF3939 domain-containing protein [Salisediminibacterium beveridgei]|uniref:DUF3939 domain-containing protein n=1 Tax=Salisediminibacterium beveridgei TaxID=632773 RepID=A0A1D7QXG5_9BACI|nr:DUF3939 domain-containing protein [Salisediminibacterium beveridgei]AOM83638.1 hypothetical protein BBEV_2297 [Salisediminibacterium beveridgei]